MMSARLAALEGAPRARRPFRAIQQPKPELYDSITRDSILRRIRYLARAYGLKWQIEQATFNRPNVDCLNDQELSALLRDMERGRECVLEGIGFDDAGLVTSVADAIPPAD